MVYLFYGLEYFLIKKELAQILKKENIEPINQNYYDLENSNINDIIEDASTFSLFGDKKAIIVENSYIFTGTTNKKLPEQNTDNLSSYLENPNQDTLLFFLINKENIDKEKIVNTIKKVGVVKEFTPVTDLKVYVKDMIEPYQIETADLNLFINRVGNQLSILEQEIKKLKTYKDKDLKITRQDILDVTCKTVDIDIFSLIDNIIIKNKEKSLESYHEMLKLGEEPIKIAIMLANQFRIMYQAKQLIKKGYSEKDIASHLDVHPYRVKLALEKSRNFKDDTLLTYLEKLAQLDYEIKSGRIDKNIGLELFILSI